MTSGEKPSADISGRALGQRSHSIPDPGGVPLSYAQEGIWALEHAARRDGPACHEVAAFRIRGPLNTGALRTAISHVIARHEQLRTVFLETSDGLRGVVPDRRPDAIEVADLTDLSADATRTWSRQLVDEEYRRPFDLAQDLPIRVIIIKITDNETLLALTVHQIAADRESLDLILREIGAAYTSPDNLDAAQENKYSDVAAQQRRAFENGAFSDQIAAWKRVLESAPQLLNLPSDRPRPPVQTYRGAARSLTVARASIDKLVESCQGGDQRTVLLSAFALLLHRYAGQDAVTVGTTTPNRANPAFRDVVGNFERAIPLIFSFEENTVFQNLLDQAVKTLSTADDPDRAPYAKVVESLAIERDPSYSPVFQAKMSVIGPSHDLKLHPELICEPFPVRRTASKLDLTLNIFTHDEDITVDAEFNPDLFEPETVERMLGHYACLLGDLSKDIDAPVDQVRILPDQERRLILDVWNATDADYPDISIIDMIEAQAADTPDAVAVEFRGESITYRELDQRAGRIARALLSMRASGFVGVYMDRSIDMVIALIAIMKSGLAYVPIDPDYPAERCRFMVEDSGTNLVLTQPAHLGVVSAWGVDSRVLDDLDHLGDLDHLKDPERQDSAPLTRTLSAGSRACMIYTSGSTGTPKGVISRHGSLFNRLYWMQSQFPLTAADRVLQKTPFSFDVSVWEFFWPLMFGARIVMAEPGGHRDPGYLRDAIAARQITAVHFVPSMLDVFLEQDDLREKCSSLRWVFCSGEALSYRTLQQFFGRIPCELHNLYGPTEAAVDVSHWPCALDYRDKIVPIGRPIANVKLYVLDKFGQLQPIGVPGELCIGGVALAEGYHNRPELNQTAFVTGQLGERLYRTGDMARYLADGQIEFLGRIDRQVKLRGFRVELGEIEANIRSLPFVHEAVVVQSEARGNQTLTAYVVSDQFSASEAKSLLARTLPHFMIPQQFIAIPAIPLTASGKADRRALPDRTLPGRTAPRPAQEEHLDELERRLLGLWLSVLPVDGAGVTESFLDLGGHSLLAAQVVIRANRELGLHLTARDIFAYPTVRALADAVRAGRIGQADDLPGITPRPENAGAPFALTALQEAYWVGEGRHFQLGGVRAHLHLELDWKRFDVVAAERAIDAMVARYDILRLVVEPDGSQRIIERVPDFRINVIDIRALSQSAAQDELSRARAEYATHGPSTDQWPLFDITAHRVTKDRCRVWLRSSLLLADAFSEAALADAFLRLYHGRPLPGPDSPASYQDHIAALKSLQDSAVYQRAGEYWRARMPLPPPPALRLNDNSDAIQSARFDRRRFRLDASTWRALRERAAVAGLTPSGLLCAAYAEVLARFSASRHFCLNVLTSMRHQVVSDNRVAGNFGSTIPLEVDFRAPDDFADRAGRLQHRLWDDLQNAQFSAIHTARAAAREKGWNSRAVLPVVFASAMDVDYGWTKELGDEIKELGSGLQTPQVYLDYQVCDSNGVLVGDWDVVEEIFPPGYVDTIFDCHLRFLTDLAFSDTAWNSGLGPQAVITDPHHDVNAALTLDADGLLHTPFFGYAARNPDRAAIFTAEKTMSYAELASMAGTIARWLVAREIKPGSFVPIVMDKGWEQVAAVLGVLAAGGVYVPIDATWPPARITHLLDELDAAVVLTQSRWPSITARPALNVDLVTPGTGAVPAFADRKAQPDDLAYVIYTSGSTGQPKGVAITHRGAVNTIADIVSRFGVGPDDRVVALSSLSFDLSVFDIFGLLAVGGAVVMPDPKALREPTHWLDLITKFGVTIWNSVPAFMRMLTEYLHSVHHPTRSLRLVMLSGDWIPVTLPAEIRRHMSPTHLISLGGATEASIWSILYPIEQVDPSWHSIPYGFSMTNQCVDVLDENLNRAPVKETGEIYISGVGLAREYLHRPELTAERFIRHPRTGERLYRTGDLGRWLSDGAIEFLGRQDSQVKIQGYRIELGEIESVLRSHPDVKDTVVAAHDAAAGARTLIAFVVPIQPESLDIGRLRQHLADQLPTYMIPATIEPIDMVPLTANGKIDRAALPEPITDVALEAARTDNDDIEQKLSALCAPILEVPDVGINEDFFDLGGNSVAAIRLINRVREQFGVELPIAMLFSAPTVGELATSIRDAREKATSPQP